MRRQQIKRETDLQIITQWVAEESSVLDLGCGRGILLEHLQRHRRARVVGVDAQLVKVQSCVKRAVPVYHGEMEAFLEIFPENAFDWVVLSRTLPELGRPGDLIRKALRIGNNLAVGFINYGYWLNRWYALSRGTRPVNEVFPATWDTAAPDNPVTIAEFKSFAKREGLTIERAVYLRGDWKQPVEFLPNLGAGYALFHLRQ